MPDNDELLTEEPEETEGSGEENNEEPVVLRDGGGDSNNNDNDEEDNDMPDPTPLGKLKRSALLHYLDTTFNTTETSHTPSWYLIGKDVEDMSVELNPETEVKKNILDETSVTDKGYEPSFDVDTYYATPTDAIYAKLKSIALERKTDDDCKTFCLEVVIDQTGSSFDGWMEEVIVKPTSYGGPQGGVSIPYTVTFTGNRVKGTVTMSGKTPTWAPPSP